MYMSRKNVLTRLLTVLLLAVSAFPAIAANDRLPKMKTLWLKGTASEDGQPVRLQQISPNGKETARFEAYLELQTGSFTLSGRSTDGDSLSFGQGPTANKLSRNGKAFSSNDRQVVRIVADMQTATLSITPLNLYLKGTIAGKNTTLSYAGQGRWQGKNVLLGAGHDVEFTGNWFYFCFNQDDRLAVKRLRGSRTEMRMPAEGYACENIMLCRGSYDISLDMRRHTFTLNAPVDDYRISQFGSSVSNGEGADYHLGYAWLFDQQLQDRLRQGLSRNPFRVSEISIGGNTTVSLLRRYDDLIHNYGRYVVFGLSLGNEGIHEAKDKQKVFHQFRDNMLRLIRMARRDGKTPVVMNNYTRADYTAQDYDCVKRMNMLIHQWDVPSVNTLGAIDDGQGRWVKDFQRTGDAYHPNTAGHREFFYAMPPSLFDAIRSGKPMPKRDMSQMIELKKGERLTFQGEGTVHPFTICLRVAGNQKGKIATFSVRNGQREGSISVTADGHIAYTSPITGRTIVSRQRINDKDWHLITLSHYYAWGHTTLYLDREGVSTSERMVPDRFYIGDSNRRVSRLFGELSFWRSGMNQMEIDGICDGLMLNSSLELYVPMTRDLDNKAMSMNELKKE